jgi:4-diphosphocytidyl-2-C-methyl-D-erythritol kinase
MPAEVWWKAPAKINLYLKVLDRRPDNYHNISSLFQMVSLYDRLRFQSARRGIRLITRGEPVPTDSGNLVYQAAERLIRSCRRKGGVVIELEKQIPLGAGLGGGSSDAAAALLGLRWLWRLRIPHADLRALALDLGSDVPFFLNGPTAFVQGRGEEIVMCRLARPWWLLIVNPGFQVSTAWAYQRLAAIRAEESKTGLTNPPERLRMSTLGPVPNRLKDGQRGRFAVAKEVLDHLENSLERITGAHYPIVFDIKARLLAEGAQGALMSGSGPTVFGLFSNRGLAKQAADRLRGQPGWRIWIVKTLQRSPQR